MNQTRRQFLRQTAIGVAAMLPLGTARTVNASTRPAGTTAVAAGDFLKSIGVCSSITGRGETLDGTIEALTYTGIRFVRCGLEDRISVNDMVELHKRTGARIAYGLLSGGTDLGRLTLRVANVSSVALTLSDHPVVLELSALGAGSAAQSHGQTERKS